MQLNTLKPGRGSKFAPKRLGRGVGSGLGKTSGKGHKGQHARAGGFHKLGFEGGQMPMQRRLPKFGFRSKKGQEWARLGLYDLNSFEGTEIDISALKKAGIITHRVDKVKIYLSGKIEKAVTLKGIAVTEGVRKAIEKAGGKVN